MLLAVPENAMKGKAAQIITVTVSHFCLQNSSEFKNRCHLHASDYSLHALPIPHCLGRKATQSVCIGLPVAPFNRLHTYDTSSTSCVHRTLLIAYFLSRALFLGLSFNTLLWSSHSLRASDYSLHALPIPHCLDRKAMQSMCIGLPIAPFNRLHAYDTEEELSSGGQGLTLVLDLGLPLTTLFLQL
jgi:hypothetical protein